MNTTEPGMAGRPSSTLPEASNALVDAYNILSTTKDAPGKKEQAFDRFSNRIAAAGGSPTLSYLNSFYESNSEVISAAAAGISSVDNKTIDNAISGFAESAKIVMTGLDALGQAHPFIAVAVVAFKLVVTLDMTRRENNQKVMAVKIQMQQMMCTLFQLRRVKDPNEIGPDGVILGDRMQPLMEQIAKDIKECGSACDVYIKKSFIAKTLKSKIYESRLAEYAARFMDYRDQLDKSLTVHIVLGVDVANEKLDNQTSRLESIENKLDMLTQVFRKLDTPREKEVMQYLEDCGGAKAVVNHNELLEVLVKKSGETMIHLADKSSNTKSETDSVKEKLKKELAEDVDLIMQRNVALFDRKLEIQSRNITDAVEKQGQYIVSFLSAGTHDKIKDTDLQNLWREMGWKGSVKARHFVLALRDYFIDQFAADTPSLKRNDSFTAQKLTAKGAVHMALDSGSLHGLGDDRWTLDYINVAHLQSILEAIDDDGTGFISIKEVNTFIVERPKGWGLLHWIAFWAKGWEMSLADYKNRIFLILQEMNNLLEDVLKENRYYVDTYLRHYPIVGIESILRSTKTAKDYGNVCAELVSLTEAYTAHEEERLQENLDNICYDMDSAATVTLITGPGRIERYLLPILFLTLRRHLEVFYYACKHVVDSEEFSHMATTLGSIFDIVEQRIDSLGAIYKQVHVDLNSHLVNFALGMFHDLSVNKYARRSQESLIPAWQDTSKTKNESEDSKFIANPECAKPIFSFNPDSQNNYQGVWLNWPSHSFDINPFTKALDGCWTGHFFSSQGQTTHCALGLTQLMIEVDPEDKAKLTGAAVTYSGRLEVYGRRRPTMTKEGEVTDEEFDLIMSFEDGFSVRLLGYFDSKREELVGPWYSYPELANAQAVFDNYPFGKPIATVGTEEGGSQDKVNNNEGTGDNRDAGDDAGKDIIDESRGDESYPDNDDTDTKTSASANGPDIQTYNAIDDSSVAADVKSPDNTATNAGSDAPKIVPEPEKEDEVIKYFILRRTPVEIDSYRQLLFEGENRALARWAFALEAVLHLVRRRLWSWNQFKSWNADRRMFLDFYKRNWSLATCNFMTPHPITLTERLTWQELKIKLPPASIRLCVETLEWSLFRLPFHYAVACDGCRFRLLDHRYICLTCMDPDMTNSFDLCSSCMDKPAKRHDFTHAVDHTLIKCRQYVHQYFFPWLINEARLMTARLKKTFLELSSEAAKGHVAEEHGTPAGSHSEPLCGCCTKPVRVPCWVCITCARETYICMDCEEKELPVLKDGPGSSVHRPDHHLLRLHNLEPAHFETEKPDLTLVRISTMEATVSQRFKDLEAALEGRFTALETKVEARLATFESLLKRIATQLHVPPEGEDQPQGENNTPANVVTSMESD